jgi:hypothetical protein
MLIQRRQRIGLGVISWGGATNAPIVGTRSLGPAGVPTAGQALIPTAGPSSGFAVHVGPALPAVTVPPALAAPAAAPAPAPAFSAPQTGATSSIAPTVTSASTPAAAPASAGGAQSGGAWSGPSIGGGGPSSSLNYGLPDNAFPDTSGAYANVGYGPGLKRRGASGAPTWLPWAIIAALAFVVGKELK